MTDDKQHFGPNYLKSILELRPTTTEELSEKKRLIDVYFLHLDDKRKSSETKSIQPRSTPPPSSPKNTLQSGASKRLKILFLSWAIFIAIFSLWSIAISQPIQPIVLLVPSLIALFIVAQKRNRKVSANKSLQKRTNHKGSDIVEKKKQDYERYFGKLLNAESLRRAYDPAEECLGLLKYLQKHEHTGLIKASLREINQDRDQNPNEGNEVDPIHTLIERLIDDHQLEAADQLSRLYLHWLNPDLD